MVSSPVGLKGESMNNEENQASVPMDWAQLFQGMQSSANVPFTTSQRLDVGGAMYRGLYLNLGEIATEILQSPFNPPLVQIFADVLAIPEALSWPIQNGVLMIVARRVEVGKDVAITIDYQTGTLSSLVLYCDELQGPLTVTAITEENGGAKHWGFPLTAAPASGGEQILIREGIPTRVARSFAQGLPIELPQNVADYLSTEFIYASLFYDQRPELALGMFTWIKNWSSASNELLGQFLRSASMVALLSQQAAAKANGATFVPFLSAQIYTQLVAAYVTEAQDYENNYLALTTQKVVTAENIKIVETLLANKVLQNKFVAQSCVQAESNYNGAMAAVTAARAQFETAQRLVQATQIDFKDKGVPEWERQKILDAVISLATAIGTFAVGIAGMMGGNEAAGAVSAEAAVQGAKAVESAAQAGSEIAAKAKKLGDIMKSLTTAVDALQKVYAFSTQVITAAQDIRGATGAAATMQKMDVFTGGADITATAAWQVYQLNADDALSGPISDGVGYASELKLAIDTVASYGQALAAAQVAAIQAGQQYAQLQLQLTLAEDQQAQLQSLVASLKVGDQFSAAVMQAFYRRYIDVKSALFAALENYRASYYYWALQASSVSAQIVNPIQTIDSGLADLTAITLDTENALSRFSNPPQTMAKQQVVITDPKILASFRNTLTATWVLGLDEVAFQAKDRVRISRVRIWLEGLEVPTDDYILSFRISNNGIYEDRYKSVPYQFTARPLEREFEYRVSPNNEGNSDRQFNKNGSSYAYIETDGSVEGFVAYAYFEPTPFSQWTVQLTNAPKELDLSNLQRITMEFAGSLIPSSS